MAQSLTEDQIVKIEYKLALVDEPTLQPSEIRYIEYLQLPAETDCEQWLIVYKIVKKRLANNECSAEEKLNMVVELASVDGCDLGVNPKDDVEQDSNYLVGFGFNIGGDRC